MYCSNCGHGMPEDSRYCGECGAAQPAETAPEPAPEPREGCGHPMAAGDAFCGECGMPRGPRPVVPAPPQARSVSTPVARHVQPPRVAPAPERTVATPLRRASDLPSRKEPLLRPPIIAAGIIGVIAVAVVATLLMRSPETPARSVPPDAADSAQAAEHAGAAESPPVAPAARDGGWIGLIEQTSGRALVLEPVLHRTATGWRHDWPEGIEDDGAQSAATLNILVQTEWLSRPGRIPLEWQAMDAKGTPRAIRVSRPATVISGCVRLPGLLTDVPLPRSAGAFIETPDGEIVLVRPVVVASGLPVPVAVQDVAPGMPLASATWGILPDLDALEQDAVQRWLAEAGSEGDRVAGTGIPVARQSRALASRWTLQVQSAVAPLQGATPVFFAASRTYPFSPPGGFGDCPSIVTISGWALLRGSQMERLSSTLDVERGDCDRGPPVPRVLAVLEDDGRPYALQIVTGYEAADVELAEIGVRGGTPLIRVPRGGC